jgi:predicted ATP-grasp superfamily ATP-dependent carboligase
MTGANRSEKSISKQGAVIIEGHVQGLANTRALGEAGIPVVVVDSNNCLARYSRYCTGFFYSPDFKSDDLALFLLDLARREGLEGWLLIPSNDHAVHTISRNRESLGRVFRLTTPGTEIIDLIYDKKNLLDIATDIGIAIPATCYFKTADDAIPPGLRFPVITRGRFGLSFYKAMKAKALFAVTEEELRAQLRHISSAYSPGDTLTQTVIPFDGTNRTVSFTAFCTDGEIRSFWAGRKLREHPWRFGTATFAESIECRECLEPTARLLRKLNYSGVCEVEYIRDPEDGEYKLIEMNARTWLWVGLARACGIDYALMAYRYVNGLEMSYPADYEKGVKWINYLTDTWFSFRAMVTGKLKPREYFASMKGKRIRAVFSRKDLLPSLALLMLSFYIARKRG